MLSLFVRVPFCQVDVATFCIFVNLMIWQLAIVSIWCFNKFCQIAIKFYIFVNLMFYQLAILSTCHFVNLPFCQLAILSICHFVNLPFCQLAMSPCHFVTLPFCQLASLTPLGIALYIIQTFRLRINSQLFDHCLTTTGLWNEKLMKFQVCKLVSW